MKNEMIEILESHGIKPKENFNIKIMGKMINI